MEEFRRVPVYQLIFRKLFFLLLPLLLLSSAVRAQSRPGFFEGIKESYRSKPKFIIGFDSRRSFVSSRDVKLWGLRAGFEMAPKVRMGFGFYGLSTPFYRNFIRSDAVGNTDTLNSRLRFNYFSIFWEYVILDNRRWEFCVPLHIGVGSSEFEGVDDTRNPIGVTELSVQGLYRPIRYFGIGAGVGFRVLVPGNEAVKENFNSALYAFKLKVYLNEIYKAIFKKGD